MVTVKIGDTDWEVAYEIDTVGTDQFSNDHVAVMPDAEGNLPDGYDTCINDHDMEGWHPDDLIKCTDGPRCPLCPCRHRECYWSD